MGGRGCGSRNGPLTLLCDDHYYAVCKLNIVARRTQSTRRDIKVGCINPKGLIYALDKVQETHKDKDMTQDD